MVTLKPCAPEDLLDTGRSKDNNSVTLDMPFPPLGVPADMLSAVKK